MSQLKILKTIQLNIQESIHWLKDPQRYFASGSGCYRFLPLEEACTLFPALGLKVSSCFGITFHFHEGVNLTDTEMQFYQNCPDRKAIGLYRFKHTKAPDSPLTLQGSPIGLRFLELFMANPPMYQDAARGHSRAFKSLDTIGEAFEEFLPLLEEWVRYLDYRMELEQSAKTTKRKGKPPDVKKQKKEDEILALWEQAKSNGVDKKTFKKDLREENPEYITINIFRAIENANRRRNRHTA